MSPNDDPENNEMIEYIDGEDYPDGEWDYPAEPVENWDY
jgi:hypothetical protein